MSPPALLTTSDAERWKAALPAEVCVMGSLELARATEARTGCAARLLVAELGDGARIVYPFFLRPVSALPFARALGEGLFDTFTPEYTGPLYVGKGPASAADARCFARAADASLRAAGVVAEFAHLSPWHAELGCLDASGVVPDRDLVWLDLTRGEDGIWNQSFSSDARRMVRQSQREGVAVRRAHSREDVLQFHRLYAATMLRREAPERYCYPSEYFLSLNEIMPDHCLILLAEHGGRAIAGGLLFHDANDVYWHLSAADLQYARVRPVNAYVFEMIRWAVGAGKRRLLCGGGHYGRNDGIFRFKASLSPLRARFHVYKRIHDPELYGALVRARWGSLAVPVREPFFPAYRASPEPPPRPSNPGGDSTPRSAGLGV